MRLPGDILCISRQWQIVSPALFITEDVYGVSRQSLSFTCPSARTAGLSFCCQAQYNADAGDTHGLPGRSRSLYDATQVWFFPVHGAGFKLYSILGTITTPQDGADCPIRCCRRLVSRRTDADFRMTASLSGLKASSLEKNQQDHHPLVSKHHGGGCVRCLSKVGTPASGTRI